MSENAPPLVMTSGVISHPRPGLRQVLIVKPTDWPYPGRWTFPHGRVGPEEAPEAALRRIVGDLLNLKVQIVFGQPPFDMEWGGTTYRWRFFFGRALDDECRRDRYAELRWVARATLCEYELDPVAHRVATWMLEENPS